LDTFEGMLMDTNIFRANTVYFDFDRSTVRPSERAKVEDVAAQLKLDAYNKLLIEGHCDERGTEEYNRALGERRALALREYIVNLGISPDRIRTLSYGEDRPAVEGFDEAAWSRNRRGEFILLRPQ
jgi:peptidoglycan-associated lipoprotein